MNQAYGRTALSLALAVLLFSGAAASARQLGSDGKPFNGIALLYAHLPSREDGAGVDATLELPAIPTNQSWYANWIMVVGQSPDMAHQTFVQIGLIRRPHVNAGLHLFIASQREKQNHIRYRQLGRVPDGMHRFAIARSGDAFVLWADNREVARISMPALSIASRLYAQVGPEVYAQGDRLSGIIAYAGVEQNGAWRRLEGHNLCRYSNHGLILTVRHSVWSGSGRFDRRLPSGFKGDCHAI